jgi:hypothetical protein
MRAQTEAMRALAYYVAGAIDRARRHPDKEVRLAQQRLVDLLIPVVKAWCTDAGVEIASVGIQVHGGMGFIEETGAAQHLRDSRILPIYEGTNGIQANDLIGRKLLRDRGAAAHALLAEMRRLDAELADAELPAIRGALAAGIEAFDSATQWLLADAVADAARAMAGAVPFLNLTGTVVAGWLMARSALAARRHLADGEGDAGFHQAKLLTARFYAEHFLALAPALLPAVSGGATIMTFDLEHL